MTNKIPPVFLLGFSLLGLLPASAATYTFTATSGGAWNVAANWDGNVAPPHDGTGSSSDVRNITLASPTTVISSIYRDTGTTTYTGGQTYTGTINLNRGTFQFNHAFQTGSNGTFNIGDGIGPANDAVVSILDGGSWMPDRHNTGTYTVNIFSDGAINATGTGKLDSGNFTGRNWEFNVSGGSITTATPWILYAGTSDQANFLNISAGGTVNIGGGITVFSDVIDFTDTNLSSSFTAAYGGSFANLAAVNSAFGSRFTASGGGTLQAIDNGSSFTVSLIPEPSSLLLTGLGCLVLLRRKRCQ